MLRRIITILCRVVLRVFFRRIEVVGQEHVPASGGVIFLVNHPNALVDPLFLLCLAPRRVSFLAKSTLLRMPVVGAIARALDTLPVYRQQDAGEDTGRNRETFQLARRLLARGGSLAICPEGVSHNEPRLLPVKTGAARIALGAAGENCAPHNDTKLDVAGDAEVGNIEVCIVPVGLYYTAKSVFRSSALLHFGASLPVPRVALEANGEPPRECVAQLSAEIETRLRELVINADSDRTLAAIADAERIWSSDLDADANARPAASLHRELGLRQRFIAGYDFHQQHAASVHASKHSSAAAPRAVVAELERRVRRYDRILRFARVEPRDLTTIERAPGVLLRFVCLRVLLIVVLLPVAIFGAITHYPPYRLIGFCARRFARGSDDMLATLKIVFSLLGFPLTWLLLYGVAACYVGGAAALLMFVFAPLAGYVALRFLEIEARLGEQLRVLYLARREPKFFSDLLAERRRIREQIAALADAMQPSASD